MICVTFCPFSCCSWLRVFEGKLYIRVCDIVGQTQIDVKCYITLSQLNIIVDFLTSPYKCAQLIGLLRLKRLQVCLQ